MGTDRPRYTVSVDEDLFKQIEDFRFGNRFATRSDATVELIRLGLAQIQKDMSTPDGLERLRKQLDDALAKDAHKTDAQ